MNRYLLVILLLFFYPLAVKAQPLSLPTALQHSYYEYSGMCMYNGSIYLLPQNKRPEASYTGVIFAIDTSAVTIDNAGNAGVPDAAVHTLSIDNFREMAHSIDKFSGFEAMVIVNDAVFLTVETDADTDYLVKGYLMENSVKLTGDRIALPKLHRNGKYLPNAGYEALSYRDGKLIVGFEYNYLDGGNAFYLIDTSFSGSGAHIQSVPFVRLPFRLTDVAALADGSMLAINHYWNLNGNSNHRESYYREIDNTNDPDLKHWAWNQCFTRILHITVDNAGRQARWQTAMIIPNKDCINWEGIVPFRSGVLLISDDNSFPILKTKFRYYPFDGNR